MKISAHDKAKMKEDLYKSYQAMGGMHPKDRANLINDIKNTQDSQNLPPPKGSTLFDQYINNQEAQFGSSEWLINLVNKAEARAEGRTNNANDNSNTNTANDNTDGAPNGYWESFSNKWDELQQATHETVFGTTKEEFEANRQAQQDKARANYEASSQARKNINFLLSILPAGKVASLTGKANGGSSTTASGIGNTGGGGLGGGAKPQPNLFSSGTRAAGAAASTTARIASNIPSAMQGCMSNPQCASLLLNTANTAFNVPKIHNIDTSSFNHGSSASSSHNYNADNNQQGQQAPSYSNYNAGDTSSQAKAYDAWANYLIHKFKNGGDINASPITPTGGFTWTEDSHENVYERNKNDDSNKSKQWQGLNANSGSAAAGGMPPDGWEPDDDGDEWKKNPEKGESKVWKEFKHYKKDVKTNGLNGKDRQYYKWDHTHNDIEVYNNKEKHLGSMNPRTGKMYKPAVPGRKL